MGDTRLSKALTLIPRHKPPASMRPDGFVPVEDVLRLLRIPATIRDIMRVVQNSDKQRFELCGNCIRAVHGHSVNVPDLLVSMDFHQMPDIAVHGTYQHLLLDICRQGLLAGGPLRCRQYVQLCASDPIHGGVISGPPRDCDALLWTNCRKAYLDGHKFWISKNGVLQSNDLPPKYLLFARSLPVYWGEILLMEEIMSRDY